MGRNLTPGYYTCSVCPVCEEFEYEDGGDWIADLQVAGTDADPLNHLLTTVARPDTISLYCPIRAKVARRIDLRIEALAVFAQDRCDMVRVAMLMNPVAGLPDWDMLDLSRFEVRHAVWAKRHLLMPEHIEFLEVEFGSADTHDAKHDMSVESRTR